MEQNFQTSSPRSAAAGEAPGEMLEASPDALAGRASPRAGAGASRQIEALTRAMAAGEEAAFGAFYDAYFDRLLRYLLVVTGGNEDSAREALQLALVRVVRHVKPFDAEEKFWSWLTVLARSALADESRKRRRYFALLERFTRQRDEPSAPDDGEADEQLRALLEKQLSALPLEERELVGQKYLLRQSVREIADGLETTEKAVESRLSRVRRKLKDAVLAELKNEAAMNK